MKYCIAEIEIGPHLNAYLDTKKYELMLQYFYSYRVAYI